MQRKYSIVFVYTIDKSGNKSYYYYMQYFYFTLNAKFCNTAAVDEISHGNGGNSHSHACCFPLPFKFLRLTDILSHFHGIPMGFQFPMVISKQDTGS